MSILTNDEAYDDLNYLVATVNNIGTLIQHRPIIVMTDPDNEGVANYTEQENLWVRCVETGVEIILVPSGGIVQDKTNCKLPIPPNGTTWTYKIYAYTKEVNEIKNTGLHLVLEGYGNTVTLNKAFKFRIARCKEMVNEFGRYNGLDVSFKVEEHDVTSLVWDMSSMFQSNTFNHIDSFSMASCTTAYSMFHGTHLLNPLPKLDTSNVVNMKEMFGYGEGPGLMSITEIDTSSATNMNFMFHSSDIEVFDFVFKRTPGLVTDTGGMFNDMPKIRCMRGMESTNTPGPSNDMFGGGTAERLVANGIPSYAMPNMADGHGWERVGSCLQKTRMMHGSIAIRKLKFGTKEPRFMFLNGIMLYPTVITVDNNFVTIDTDRIDMSNI